MRRMLPSTLVFGIVLSMQAAAHDFWIQPDTLRPAPGAVVKVGLRVGDAFPGEPVNRDPERIVKFVAVSQTGETEILGVAGRDPAGLFKPAAPGIYILGYRSNRARVELEADKFEAYLAETGLDSIIAARKERGESVKPGREVYSRCAKALLHVAANDASVTAAPSNSGFDRPLGFTLELIPAQDPASLKPGDPLTVQLLFEGKPLPGALVHAATPADPQAHISARTDAEGRALLKLPRAGFWRIAAVHMTPAPSGLDADWESFWATLTFDSGPNAP